MEELRMEVMDDRNWMKHCNQMFNPPEILTNSDHMFIVSCGTHDYVHWTIQENILYVFSFNYGLEYVCWGLYDLECWDMEDNDGRKVWLTANDSVFFENFDDLDVTFNSLVNSNWEYRINFFGNYTN